MDNNVYFYSRISTIGQNAARQVENFKKNNFYKRENVFLDKISGAVPFFERPSAIELFDIITERSEIATVVVDSIDRLGRNLIDVLNTIELFTSNKIAVTSIKENFTTIDENGNKNALALIVIAVMGSLAELERNRIKERQAEGINIAKANGKYRGRKIGSLQTNDKLLARHSIVADKLKRGYTIREIAELTKKSSSTILKVKKALSI